MTTHKMAGEQNVKGEDRDTDNMSSKNSAEKRKMDNVSPPQSCECSENGEQEHTDDSLDKPEVIEEVNPAPDGGYGWIIVLGSFVVHILIGGIERSAGTLFLKFDERYHETAAVTAWATSIPAGVRLTLGPVCSALCNKFSCRSVVIVGAVILSISMVMTVFSPNVIFLYFSFGFVGGIGRSFAYAPAVIMVGLYFNKKRGMAVGTATSGVGFGGFLFPTIIEILFMQYGFGAFFVLGGFMLNMAICGVMFRSIWLHRKFMEYDLRHKEGKLQNKDEEKRLHVPKYLQQQKNHIAWHSVESIEIKLDDIENKGKITPPNPVIRKSISERPTSWIKKILCCGNDEKSKSMEKKQIFEFSLLKDIRFLCFCLAILLFTIAFQSAFVFIPPYAKQKGMSDLEASYLIALAGGFDGVGRICSGFVLDLKRVKKYRIFIYNGIMMFVGMVSFIIPSLHTFTKLAILCSFYGLLVGTYISQKSVIIVDILGVKKLVNSFGMLICFQGIGMFLGPPIAGAMKDSAGTFDNGFYFGGGSMIFGALILAASNVHHRIQQGRDTQ